MSEKKISKEARIGISVVIAMIVLFLGFNYLKGVNILKPSTYYYAKIDNVTGLSVSSPIYVNGYKVGQIHDILFNPYQPSEIVLQLSTEKNYKLPRGSVAYVTIELVGTAYVTLKFDENEKNFLTSGDTIQAIRKNSITEKASEEILPQLQQTLPRIDSVLTSLQRILENPAIHNTFHSIETTGKQLELATMQVNNLLGKDIPLLVNSINTITADVEGFSGNLKQIDLANTISKADTILSDLQVVSSKLNDPNNNIGLLLNDGQLYNNLTLTFDNANKLLLDLREHPKRYVHFSIFGKKDK